MCSRCLGREGKLAGLAGGTEGLDGLALGEGEEGEGEEGSGREAALLPTGDGTLGDTEAICQEELGIVVLVAPLTDLLGGHDVGLTGHQWASSA